MRIGIAVAAVVVCASGSKNEGSNIGDAEWCKGLKALLDQPAEGTESNYFIEVAKQLPKSSGQAALLVVTRKGTATRDVLVHPTGCFHHKFFFVSQRDIRKSERMPSLVLELELVGGTDHTWSFRTSIIGAARAPPPASSPFVPSEIGQLQYRDSQWLIRTDRPPSLTPADIRARVKRDGGT